MSRGFRKLEPPLMQPQHWVRVCVVCERDLQDVSSPYLSDFYPQFTVSYQDIDDNVISDDVCSLRCVKAWADKQLERSPGWEYPEDRMTV